MCLGVPLQVESLDASGQALCRVGDVDSGATFAATTQKETAPSGEGLRAVDTLLLDAPPKPGDWLLVHVSVAIRALEPLEAMQIRDALAAVTAAATGQAYEHLIADLVDREPQLPPHLRTTESSTP